jgi:hypothetical protein
MQINERRVELGAGLKNLTRCVYDIRNNVILNFQTGFVHYDNNEIPVWRPFYSSDKAKEVYWRNGVWKNIYALQLKIVVKDGRRTYKTANLECSGKNISIPKVEVKMEDEFTCYLLNQNMNNSTFHT